MWDSRPAEPRIHDTAIAIARRCVWIVQACLREEERLEAVREFYAVAREELEQMPVTNSRSRRTT
jgi:hypothetical protein